ncbi:MAG: hypothetical protein K2X87_19550 [Gemmataceae bacterium]|nr:hypothetical protein [Gemmataceae bacterium]
MSVDLREGAPLPAEAAETGASPPPPAGASPTGIPATDAARIARAKDLIAGRITADPMPTPPAVRDYLARIMAGKEDFFTPEAVRWAVNEHNLQFYFGGRVVACYTTPDGDYIPLAADDDITPLFAALTPAEMSVGGASIYHPETFIIDGPDWY